MRWHTQILATPGRQPAAVRYALALAFAVAALGIRWVLHPLLGHLQPYSFFYVAIGLAGWWGGLGPAVVAAVAGLVGGSCFLIESRVPVPQFLWLPPLTYLVISSCFVYLITLARRSQTVLLNHTTRLSVAEEELKRQNALLEAVLEACPVGIIVADAQGRILRMNSANRKLWGEAPFSQTVERYGDWKGWWVDGSERHGRRLAPSEWGLARALKGELVPGDLVEIEAFENPPVRRTMLNFGAPVRDRDGRVVGGVVAQLDVTGLKTVERALRDSEQRFRAVAENIPQMAWMTDAEGAMLWFNRRWQEYTGKGLEEMRAEGWESVHRPDQAAEIRWGWEQALRTGERWEGIYPILGRTGGFRWFLSRAFPIRDARGKITHWFGTDTDITEQRLAEQALAVRAREQRAVAELGLTGLRETDLQTLFDQSVRTVSETLEVELCKIMQLLPAGTEMRLRAGVGWREGLVGKAMVTAKPTSQAGYTLASGRPVIVEDLATETRFPGPGLLHEHGVASGISCIIRGHGESPWGVLSAHTRSRRDFSLDDVHFLQAVAHVLSSSIQRKEAEEELAGAKKQLEHYAEDLERTVAERTAKLTETVHELESFSYSLSHDMRAPLRAMKGFSQILEADYGQRLGEEGIVLLRKISTAAGRLDQLIKDVLAYSKVVRESVTLRPVSVEQLTRQLIDENPALQPPRAVIEVRAPLLPVLGHEAYLTQVLSNLLYNAVKFVPPGRTPRVSLWTEPVDGRVRLSVQDNGIGIPKEAIPKLFGMFQRLHGSNEYEGTGIGLAIVRKAVERMGGRHGVESEPGRGSTFWIELGRPAEAARD